MTFQIVPGLLYEIFVTVQTARNEKYFCVVSTKKCSGRAYTVTISRSGQAGKTENDAERQR